MQPSRFFPQLAFATVFATLGLIVWGAVVRVTDSGLGCGDSWPLCEGDTLPPLDNLTAWIEWSHRLLAVLIGLLGLGMLYLAWQRYRRENRQVAHVTTAAAILYVFQAMLGRAVVVGELPPALVTLHLGTAMLLLGALLWAAIYSFYQPIRPVAQDHVTALAYATTALTLLIILSGALVRGSGATLACNSWPLCNGQLIPTGQGQLAVIHMLHRLAVSVLGVALVLLVWQALRFRAEAIIRILVILALAAYCAQAVVGALFIESGARPFWGAAHVGLAATTWALLVAFVAIETLNRRAHVWGQSGGVWPPQSEPTSS